MSSEKNVLSFRFQPKRLLAASSTASRCAISAAILVVTAPAAHALGVESARESCRMSVGRPIVQVCMRASGGAGNIEACREKARPQVRACVMAALDKANGRANVAVAIPTEAAPKVAAGGVLPAGFIAPPRTITDITAILDSEKADLKTIEKLNAEADAKPTGKESREDLAQFYFDRGNARAQLGRLADTIADANKAIEVGRGAISANMMGRLISLAAQQYMAAGDPKKAFELFQRLLRETSNQKGARGYLVGANRAIASILIQMGDIAQAEAYLRRSQPLLQEARTSGHPIMRSTYNTYGQNWEAEVEIGRAMLFEARGQFREAEASYKLSELRKRAAIKPMLSGAENPPSESSMVLAVDLNILNQARMKARQGRLAEAEVDARRALLSQLKNQGKYSPTTPRFIAGLAGILVEQGRYAEAEQLVRVSLDITRTVGVAEDSLSTVQLLSQLGNILNLQRKGSDAIAVFAQIDNAIAKWEPARREAFELNGGRIYSLYASGQIEAGIAAAEQLVKKQISRVGENHLDTASARGTLAIGLMRAGRDQDAIREFRTAIPILMASSRENADDDDTTAVAARNQRLQGIVEAYLNMLAREKNPSGDVGVETFGLADAIRGRSVQQALAASSARAAAKDPALAELVRKEQDLGKQVNAQLGTLTNVLSLPSHERDEKGVQAINASINALRADRTRARQEISRRFPVYADLVAPKPPSVEQIRATLADGEAMLSFYFGQTSSFVWAVPKNGPVAFAAIKATSGDIESKVRKLREALEPQAAMISDIPPFDLKLAHELYSLLLQPVESGWKPAKNLIVVTNGALGLLPLSLLPTAPAEIRSDDDPLFASYKDVPWLARTHAVTTVPSAAALRTLRQLPPGKPGRGELIAFGDPYFSKEQEAEADNADKVRVADASGNTTRGGPLKRRNSPKLDGVDSAELAMLPRLPDTSEELKSIALALQADPSKVLNLGKQASEQAVKTMDLSGFKVLAFATHGLVPGELNGLSQPALALSSPTVTGGEGDGLLTMEEILGLKLDADWVVLSACNTGAGAGAGAEAASGLGRAFFYAGTRALLVTNWSVHSQSARELVTDLFRRQAQDPKLTRGEALRLAMMALVDGPGYAGADGKAEFAYAHPLFWAPYTIIGDGGVR
ncbi:CHAT domain-containing protein [Bradyrhizobium sp. 200]|nr:CHAT domain-containing protein [Bradyrhizobium sp. 200]